MYLITFLAIMGSAISAFYYLRIIKWMFFKDTAYFHYKDIGDVIYPTQSTFSLSLLSSLVLGSTLFVILTFLLFPSPLLDFSLTAISSSLL
jgi:NADH:ubiquinone oxidoreductase subunit 2 (subunit N)